MTSYPETWWNRIANKRAPNFTVGRKDDPYLMRWYLIPRNPIFNIYLHLFIRSDDDRALHDHPWFNLSYILQGSYVERTIAAGGINHRTRRRAGQFKFRTPWHAHCVEIEEPCWTLFITGPKIRTWGFHCTERGFVPWFDFVDHTDTGNIGKGCDQ